MNKFLALGSLFFCLVSCDDIHIDLSLYHPKQHEYSLFKQYFNIKENTTITIENIQDDVAFFIVQIHTYVENVTLSSNYNLTYGSYVTGTNIGLYWQSHNTSAAFYLLRNSTIDESVHSLLVIYVYDKNDPIPGGCNLSFGTVVAPYQITEYNDNIIRVKSQPPSFKGISCVNNSIKMDMYHMFLNDYDNSVESYFNGVEKMLTVESILKFGRKVPDIDSTEKFIKLYSSYIGTGEVFAIITTHNNQSSAYVPVVSYGCDVSKWEESCLGPVAIHWKFLCAVQLILGVFICFFGHRFFKITVYIVSFTFGLLVTYFIISMEEYLSITEKTITAFTVGFIYGIIWLLIWKRFGVPCLTINTAFLLSGFLTASLFFYTILADISIFSNGISYWLVFLSIIILCVTASFPIAMYSHIASLTYVSSYSCVMALNYYVGGNLPYILINTYRRVAVDNFNLAVIDPPMHMIGINLFVIISVSCHIYEKVEALKKSNDIIHGLLWLLLMLFGMFIQLRYQKGKPPFPPNRRFHGTFNTTEATRLIDEDIFAPPPYTM